MKEAYYFSHDSNAHRHAKLLALRMTHGWAGYGLFWAIIEKLRECQNYQHAADYNLLAYDLRTDTKVIKSIIEDYGLFELTDINGQKFFYSERLNESMQARDEASKKMSELSKRRWELAKEKELDHTQALPTQCDSNAHAMRTQCAGNANKGKEKKGNNNSLTSLRSEESIGAKRTAFTPPTLTQVQAYIQEKQYHIDPEHFIDFYTAKGWMIGSNKMKDWKAALRTWNKKQNDTATHHTHRATETSRRGHLLTDSNTKDYSSSF